MIADYRSKIVTLALTTLFARGFANPPGLNNEGCTGEREERAIQRLHDTYGTLKIPDTFIIVPCDKDARCDGGFTWEPFMVSRERSWLISTLPGRSDWVSVSISNLCTRHLVVDGMFFNQKGSPDLRDDSAVVSSYLSDASQTLLMGYEQLYMRLYRSEDGARHVSLYGWNSSKSSDGVTYLDDFAVESL